MKLADVEGERREAEPGLSAKCPGCGSPMIARCGELRVWHWSHQGRRTCDPWWEPETEWHRAWKNNFPEIWQEFFQTAENGERHIADVKTERGLVIEFQHSPLRRDERESREHFYGNIVWVVDGRRRVRDRPKFFASLGEARVAKLAPLVVALPSKEGALLRDWQASRAPVFFDFGDSMLWRLNPRSPVGVAYLSPVLKTAFVAAHLNAQSLKGMGFRAACLLVPALFNLAFVQPAPPSPRAGGFLEYLARKQRARARFRF
jgi:hypothetical protein